MSPSHPPANAKKSRLISWFQRGTASQNAGGKLNAPSTISSPFNSTMTASAQKPEEQSRAVAVFCGSSKGKQPAFAAAAKCERSLRSAVRSDRCSRRY